MSAVSERITNSSPTHPLTPVHDVDSETELLTARVARNCFSSANSLDNDSLGIYRLDKAIAQQHCHSLIEKMQFCRNEEELDTLFDPLLDSKGHLLEQDDVYHAICSAEEHGLYHLHYKLLNYAISQNHLSVDDGLNVLESISRHEGLPAEVRREASARKTNLASLQERVDSFSRTIPLLANQCLPAKRLHLKAQSLLHPANRKDESAIWADLSHLLLSQKSSDLLEEMPYLIDIAITTSRYQVASELISYAISQNYYLSQQLDFLFFQSIQLGKEDFLLVLLDKCSPSTEALQIGFQMLATGRYPSDIPRPERLYSKLREKIQAPSLLD